jgi:ribosomal peptide maturation radical SAM protein 1
MMARTKSKLRIAFVNMPFADWHRPSLALSQMTSMIRRDFADEITADIFYVNQDMADLLGTENYEAICQVPHHLNSGLGDWLFRHIAFPEAPDNWEAYFKRFYPGKYWTAHRDQVLAVRPHLNRFCEDVIDRYRLADADIVGFTSMFAQNVPSMALARMIKERNPDALIVLGGANCEAPMGAVIAEMVPAVDFVFSGPALETFPSFLRAVIDGDPRAADAIPGIVSRRNCHEPGARVALGREHDINDACPPAYESFTRALDDHDDLRRSGSQNPVLPFETSRGCWWGQRSHCTFCGLNGQSMGYRAMAADLAVEQFTWLFGFADRYLQLTCTDNIMPRNYPAEVFEKLEPPDGVEIFYEVKLPLSRRDMKRLVDAHVTTVQPGIEALATSTLKLMGKGTTAFQNIQFLKSCTEFNIAPTWNLLIGFPGEDVAVYERYVHYIPHLIHLAPPGGVSMVRFDRFSPYFDNRGDYGLDLHPMDNYALTYPFGPGSLSDLAYFFADHNIAPYALNAIQWHGQLTELVDEWIAVWRGAEPRVLRLEGPDATGWSIRDSRSGRSVVYPTDEPMGLLIRRLSSPRRQEQVEWPGGSDDLSTRLAWLRERAMLFEEDGRILSLVVSGDDENLTDSDPVQEAPRLLPIVATR